MGVAYGLRAMTPFLTRGREASLFAVYATYIINYTAVSASGSANLYLVRKSELESGVTVRDPKTDESIGMSQVAAKQGIFKCMVCRWTFALPIFVIPAMWRAILARAKLLPARMGPMRVLLETIGVAASLFVSMPLGCGLFP